MEIYTVTLTFTSPLLGTVPKNREIYADYIASKAKDSDDELETVEQAETKGWTGFHLVDGQPILYDYVIRGFLKSACGALRRVSDTKSSKVRAYKKIIDGLVFAKPRRIPLNLSGELGVLERPLRAQTAQGERIALARSDTAPPGTTMEFTLEVLGVVSEGLLREWFDYGKLLGFGAWRSGGWGRFTYELTQTA